MIIGDRVIGGGVTIRDLATNGDDAQIGDGARIGRNATIADGAMVPPGAHVMAVIFVEAKKDGVGGVDGLGNATEVTVSPNGERGYIASEADDAVAEFSRDAATAIG